MFDLVICDRVMSILTAASSSCGAHIATWPITSPSRSATHADISPSGYIQPSASALNALNWVSINGVHLSQQVCTGWHVSVGSIADEHVLFSVVHG